MPPTYAAVYALAATVPHLFGDEEAGINVAMLVHGEQEFEWERHPEVGETLEARGTIVDDNQRRNLRFLTFETTCTDGGGKVVCRSRMLNVIRS